MRNDKVYCTRYIDVNVIYYGNWLCLNFNIELNNMNIR